MQNSELKPEEVKLIVAGLEIQAKQDEAFASCDVAVAIKAFYANRAASGRQLAQKLLASLP